MLHVPQQLRFGPLTKMPDPPLINLLPSLTTVQHCNLNSAAKTFNGDNNYCQHHNYNHFVNVDIILILTTTLFYGLNSEYMDNKTNAIIIISQLTAVECPL